MFASFVKQTPVLVPLLLLSACDVGKDAPPPPQRFVSVEVQPKAEAQRLCDTQFPAGGPQFQLPEGSIGDRASAPSPLRSGHWTWINLWATWCGPCREEMPLLHTWDGALDTPNRKLDVYFLSLDEEANPTETFWNNNPELAIHATARLPIRDGLGAFFKRYGLSEDAAIPVHLLVDPQGSVRCARGGSISESDLTAVKAVLSGM